MFRGNISNVNNEEKMALWEIEVYNYSKTIFNSSLIEIFVLGNEIVDVEMNKDAQKTSPFFALGNCSNLYPLCLHLGFVFMFLFVFYTIFIGSYYYGVFDWTKIILAFIVTLCPILAITTTFGIYALCGIRANSVMLIMPFLICGIGVNDAFLILASWHQSAKEKPQPIIRLGLILEEVGPSITITTLTNVITFGIGALTPTPGK